MGNLRIAEFHSLAYDSANHIIFGATQDNSIPQQTTPGSKSWDTNEAPWGDVPVMLVADGTGVALFRARQGEDGNPAVRILHIGFRVDRSSFEAARAELEGRGIEVSFQDHVVAHSLYFSDPDGHQLELTTYEL